MVYLTNPPSKHGKAAQWIYERSGKTNSTNYSNSTATTLPKRMCLPWREDTVQGIWRQIQANPGVNYFVLVADSRIAAACILSITPSFIRGGVAFGLIEHVVTHPDHRRKGYGEALINHALDCAWQNGCTEVMLLSGSQNKIAHAMYEKVGFDKHRKTGFVMFRPG